MLVKWAVRGGGGLKKTELSYWPSPEMAHPGTFLLPLPVLPSPSPAVGVGVGAEGRQRARNCSLCLQREVGKRINHSSQPPSNSQPELGARIGLNFKSDSEFSLLHKTGFSNFCIETVFCDFSDHRTLVFVKRDQKSQRICLGFLQGQRKSPHCKFKGILDDKTKFLGDPWPQPHWHRVAETWT